MATPPKSPPRKVGPKKVASPAAPVTAAKAPEPVKTTASVAAKAPPKVEAPAKDITAKVEAPVKAAKPMPFVIDPEPAAPAPVAPKSVAPAAAAPEVAKAAPVAQAKPAEPKPVEQSESAPKSEPAAPLTETIEAKPVEVAPVETAQTETAKTLVENEAPTPSQQAVAAPLAAALKTAADWQTPPALEGHTIMNEAIETSKKFAEDAKTRIQSMVSEFNEKAKVAMEKSSKTAEELGDITKGNLEALVESSKIAAKGLETLGQSAAEYGRAHFEKTSATLKSFASVKSPTEFFQLHSELMTSAFDTMAAETAKTSEAVLKLAGEIAQPLSSRVAIVSDKMKALAA